MAEVCITVKEYTRSDGVKVAEHDRCYNTQPLPADLENLKQSLVDDLLSKDKPTKDDVKRVSDQLLGDKGEPKATEEASADINNGFPMSKTEDGEDSILYASILKEVGGDENLANSIKEKIYTPEFKEWFGDSKVIDKNGEPLLAYHGTNAVFNEFRKDKPTIGAYGQGYYFSDSKDFASDFARGDNGVILPVFLSSQKTVDIENDELPEGFGGHNLERMLSNKGASRDFTLHSINNGYDGVVVVDQYNDKEISVFAPNQIKSIFNDGSFDSNDNNIYGVKASETILESGAIDTREEIFEEMDDVLGPDTPIPPEQKLVDDIESKASDTPIPEGLTFDEKKSHLRIDSLYDLSERVIGRAVVFEKEYDEHFSSVISSVGGEVQNIGDSIKSFDTVFKKIDTSAMSIESYSITPQKVLAENLNDVVSYKAVLPSDGYAEKIKESISGFEDRGFKLYKMNNQWGDDNMTPGVFAILEKDGQLTELQFHTEGSFNALDRVRDISKEIENGANFKESITKIKGITNSLNIPSDYKSIESYDSIDVKPDRFSSSFQPIFNDPEDTDAFERWSKGYDLIEGEGVLDLRTGQPAVIKGFHGTTHDFYEFKGGEGSPGGFLGATNYFTTDQYDAEQNYSSLIGPDLNARILNRGTVIASELDERGYFHSEVVDFLGERGIEVDSFLEQRGYDEPQEAYEAEELGDFLAERELYGGNSQVLETFLRVENPIVIDANNETYLDNFIEVTDEQREEAWDIVKDINDLGDDASQDDYFDEIQDEIHQLQMYDSPPITEALYQAWQQSGTSTEINIDTSYSSVSLSDLRHSIEQNHPILDNDDGSFKLIAGDIFNRTLINLGHDAVILKNANRQFEGMDMQWGTSHIHIPDQYKSNIKLSDGRNVTFRESTSIIDESIVKKNLRSVTDGTRWAGLTLRQILSTQEGRRFWRENGINLLPT
jgi:hypothetical protein